MGFDGHKCKHFCDSIGQCDPGFEVFLLIFEALHIDDLDHQSFIYAFKILNDQLDCVLGEVL